jgi:hypothetical protein
MSETIVLFETNRDTAGTSFKWDNRWSADEQLANLKKYSGKKFKWVDRGTGNREHIGITVQVILDRGEAARLAKLEFDYRKENPTNE